MSQLIASWGEEFRVEQIETATKAETNTEDLDSNASTLNSDRESEPAGVSCNNKKKTKGRNKQRTQNITMQPPMPPMPPTGDENLHAMLMAWYMSGYYTGLYDARKQAK